MDSAGAKPGGSSPGAEEKLKRGLTPMRTIVVSNFPEGTTGYDLECFFVMFGDSPEVSFPRRGRYALVTFKDEPHAERALAANGERMSGRRLRVKMAKWEVP